MNIHITIVLYWMTYIADKTNKALKNRLQYDETTRSPIKKINF